jgi:hypothetical protein
MVGVVVFSCKKKHIEEPVVKNSKFFLYSLEGPQLDKEKFTSFAKKLTNQSEISLDATQESYISYTNEKSGDHFSLLANGSLSFSKGIKDYLGNAKPELPSEQSVEKIAQDFLQQFSLVPQRKDELTFLHLGGVRADTPNGEVIDKMRTITYGRVVDSIPVVGSGSKIIVHVGNKGEVTGLVHRWRELSGANKKAIPISELIDEKEAAQLFKRSIEQEFGKEANVTIKSQRMVYYDGGGNYLQPAFSFESEISMESLKNTIPYLGILQALKESPEKINLLDISDNALKSLIKSDRKTESTGDRKNKD